VWYKCWTSDWPCRVYFCIVLGGSEFKSRLWYCFFFYCLLEFSWVGQSLAAFLHVYISSICVNVVIHTLGEYSRRNKSVFNKIHVCGLAKAIGCSLRPLEVDALVRQNFSPGGTLVCEVSLAYVFLTVYGVSLLLSFERIVVTCMKFIYVQPCMNLGMSSVGKLKLFWLLTHTSLISVSSEILFVYIITNSDTVATSSWPSYWEKT
jgi:hypothetical protein